MTFAGRTLMPGEARGPIVATAPLSFWGGYDPATGLVIDRHHGALGRSLAGAVLVMAVGRGSSSASGALAEALRLGTAPSVIVLSEPDPILVIGAMVADALYGRSCPIVVLSPADHTALARATAADVVATGAAAMVRPL